jgi:hypothetical protein
MEQKVNPVRELEASSEEAFTSWRSIASVVAGMVARMDLYESEEDRHKPPSYVPVAWAAE